MGDMVYNRHPLSHLLTRFLDIFHQPNSPNKTYSVKELQLHVVVLEVTITPR